MGEGAFSELHRARDTKVGRTVALRLIRDDAFTDAATKEAFLSEARAAAVLSHPNVTTLFDIGEYEGGCYLAYEFASGITLRQEIEGQAVNARRAVELAVQIADALADGHAHQLLHGDLRPNTILVTHKGSAKVLEFGLAHWTTGGRLRELAATAPESLGPDAVAVLSYMAPEQALGGSIDPRADIFSLGVLLYEMVTGRNPFAASTAAATVVNVISMVVPSPDLSAAGSRELEGLIVRATAKDIAKRPQSAAAMAAELRSIGAILDVRAGGVAPAEHLKIDEDEGSGGWWWIAAAVIAAVVALGWWLIRSTL